MKTIILRAFLTILTLTCFLYPSISYSEDYVFERLWPSEILGLRSPSGVAVDSSGNVYVVDDATNKMIKYNSSGSVLFTIEGSGNGQFRDPSGVAVDSLGNVYVADTRNHRIQKFNSNGTYINQWGTEGTGNGQFDEPSGVAVDSLGNVYVADRWNRRIQKFGPNGDYRIQWRTEGDGVAVDSLGYVYVLGPIIQKFDSNGTYINQWGTEGDGNGQFHDPLGVAVDSLGNIYVADTGNHRIQKFDSNGTYIAQWGNEGYGNGQFGWPIGVALDSFENVYVADTGNNRIQKFNSNGTHITQFGTYGSGNRQFHEPGGVAVDSLGDFYVADTYNDRIQKFSSNGTYVTQWGTEGDANGEFRWPTGVVLDSFENVYVADRSNDRIQKFNSNGNYLLQWGTKGSGNGQFDEPTGVAVDSLGNVYVADSNNCRIQKFDSNGNYLLQWGTEGDGNGQFFWPRGVAVDSLRNVYVADYYRIKKFDSNGTYITQWGTYGSGNGQLRSSQGVAVNTLGKVYVADTDNHRIQVFSPNISLILTNRINALGYEFKKEDLGTINQGQTSSQYTFNNDKVQNLAFGLNWAGSILKLSVYKPNGSLFKEEQGSPPVIIQVQNAEIGDWHYIVTGIDVPNDNYLYAIQIGTKQTVSKSTYLIWAFEEGSGTTVKDISGKDNNGSFVGDIKWVDGKNGKGVKLDGKTSYIISNTTNGIGSSAFTECLWVKFDNLIPENQFGYIRCNGIGTSARYFYFSTWSIEGAPHDAIHAGTIATDGNWGRGIATERVFKTDTWYFIAGVIDTQAGIIRVYVDGELFAYKDIDKGDTPGTPYEIWVGATPENYQWLSGTIDDVAFFNVALNDYDIKYIMMNGISGGTKLKAGWNMVSFPGTLINPSVDALIPQGSSIIPPLYTYDPTNSSYKEVSEVKPGEGYWALTIEDESLPANITPVSSLVLNLKPGWNMIGGVNGTVDFSDPQDNPDGSVIPPIYTYNPTSFGYEDKTNIESGKGYWVLAIQNCTLTLNSNAAPPRNKAIKAYATKPDWIVPVQVITDRGIKEIALGVQSGASDGFDPYMDKAMPPKASMVSTQPEASFLIDSSIVSHLSRDIRKNDTNVIWNMEVESNGGTELQWDVSSLPIDRDMILHFAGTEIDMRVQNRINVPSGKHIVLITLKDRIPTKPELLQNYPNPFNPETWIPYQLSEAGVVVISIYDVSGRLVRRLDLGHKEVGIYASREKAVHWDGRNESGERVSSGVYFYSIKAGDFVKTNKLVIVK